MNELQVFEYRQTMDVRMVMQGDEPWWVLADVCRALGLERTDSVARRLDPDEKGTHLVSTPGGPQEMTIINESGLYSVILRSDKPEAKAFKRWVTHEVLPSIRRTGRYELGGQTAPMALQGPGAAPLPLSAQSLWFTLLWLEKAQGGRGEVSASNDRLMALMGVSGHHTLAVARDTLVKAGYIAHTPGVKARPGVYKLLPQRV
ncbi:Bro-N domain-containing protein [uncultured Oscillibacter sp.]|uniref:BRO-N domain-containing protein n=1 Tax=uncultured Oscillibacter sp. TaxID=876091 RepID=UPI0026E39B08|nr:Bro-N domain-containing protein [uncultured Oscillibacter sp.]